MIFPPNNSTMITYRTVMSCKVQPSHLATTISCTFQYQAIAFNGYKQTETTPWELSLSRWLAGYLLSLPRFSSFSLQATFVLFVSPFASRRRSGPTYVEPTPLLLSSRLRRPGYQVYQRYGNRVHSVHKPLSPPNAGFPMCPTPWVCLAHLYVGS